MSETPRTDAAEILSIDEPSVPLGMVEVDFARQLERELAAANARIKRLEEAGDRLAGFTPPSTDRWAAWQKAKEARP